jgi:hypothetical protein
VEARVGGYPTRTPRDDLAGQRDRSDRYIKSLPPARAARARGRCSMSTTHKRLPAETRDVHGCESGPLAGALDLIADDGGRS